MIPQPEFHERHECCVEASGEQTYAAMKQVTAFEVRPLAPLMAVRVVPVAIRHPRRFGRVVEGGFTRARSRPVIEQFLAGGFIELAEQPRHEYVAGAIGRFWTLSDSAPIPLAAPGEFERFAEPGFAKAALNFVVEPVGAGTRLITETRVVTTSEDARRAFGRYWRLILPGSALIRRSWLAAIRRRAERTP